MVNKLRLWKSMTNKLEELQEIDKKYKNYTQVKVDFHCLNAKEEDKALLLEDLQLAEDDIIVIELPKNSQFVLQP